MLLVSLKTTDKSAQIDASKHSIISVVLPWGIPNKPLGFTLEEIKVLHE